MSRAALLRCGLLILALVLIVLGVLNGGLRDVFVKAANLWLEEAGKPAALTLSKDEGDFAGGLILRRGSIEVNCTVELLVELSQGELSAKVAELLFQ